MESLKFGLEDVTELQVFISPTVLLLAREFLCKGGFEGNKTGFKGFCMAFAKVEAVGFKTSIFGLGVGTTLADALRVSAVEYAWRDGIDLVILLFSGFGLFVGDIFFSTSSVWLS